MLNEKLSDLFLPESEAEGFAALLFSGVESGPV